MVLSRFLTSFRSSDSGSEEAPGLIQNNDGTVDLIAPDGTRTPLASGGAQQFQLLGPFTVSHSDVDPVTWFDLGVLADGTVIFDVAVFIREAFTTESEHLYVALGVTSGNDQIQIVNVAAGGTDAHAAPTSDLAARVSADWDFAPLGITRSMGMAQNGAHLLAGDQFGSNEAGSADIYCLATVPS